MRRSAAAATALAVVAALLLLLLLTPLAGGDPAPSAQDPATVRDTADQILSRDEFQPPEDSILDQVWDWIGDHLIPGDSNGPSSEGGGSGGNASTSGGSSILTVVLLVLAVVAIGFVVRALLGQPRRRKVPKADPVAIDVEERRTSDEWAEAAARHEAAGQWKDGLRCRFRSLVERLIDAGAVPDIPGRTSGELRADVRATTPPAADAFADAALLFEQAWYGDVDTGPDEARRFAALAEQVLAATGVGAPA